MCGGLFDEEISSSRPLFEYDISILSVWMNHVIVPEGIVHNMNNRKLKKTKQKKRKRKNTKIRHNKKVGENGGPVVG